MSTFYFVHCRQRKVTNRNKNSSKHFSSKLPFQTLTAALFTRNTPSTKAKVSGMFNPHRCQCHCPPELSLSAYKTMQSEGVWPDHKVSCFVTSVTESDYNRPVVQPFCFWKCAGRQASRGRRSSNKHPVMPLHHFCVISFAVASLGIWKTSAVLPQQLSKSFWVPFLFPNLFMYLFILYVTAFKRFWCFSDRLVFFFFSSSPTFL